MKINIGLGWIFSPLYYRRTRRVLAGGAFLMGTISFFTIDLAPRDASLGFSVLVQGDETTADLEFFNLSQHDVKKLNANFAFYGYDGLLQGSDYFVPAEMTVLANGSKLGTIDREHFQGPRSAYTFFCADFSGSYFVDRLREIWVVGRNHLDPTRFSQVYYKKSRYWFSAGDCTAPTDLKDHARDNGWDFETGTRRYERVGLIPSRID
jgi:hypothetical protein